jgi:hypothetical protein
MIEVYWEEKEYENAYHVLEVMKARKKMLTNYVDPKEIAKICEAVGKTNIFTKDNNNYNSVPEDDEIN